MTSEIIVRKLPNTEDILYVPNVTDVTIAGRCCAHSTRFSHSDLDR